MLRRAEGLGDRAREVVALYAQVMDRAPYQLERLPPAFFGRLEAAAGLRCRTLLLEREGDLLAAAVLLRAPRSLVFLLAGIDYTRARAHRVYPNLVVEVVAEAIRDGAARVELGQTSYLLKGRLGGIPSERGLYRDARAALKYLAARSDVNMARLVYFGESLGAAVAVELATEFQPSALILRSPFSSMTRIGAHHYPLLPVRQFLRDRYPSIDRMGRITCPLLVIAGDDDRVVPLEDTQRLFDAAHGPKQLVVIEGADHNDEELMWGPRVIGAIDRFLKQ